VSDGVIIRPLEGGAEYAACVELQERTWGEGFAERVPATILRITQKLGGIASGAFDEDGRLLGFVFGMTGWVDGEPLHWSDMLAVRPAARDRGIGDRLKRHQRAVLLSNGVERVQWTFEPLEARNAYLNLTRLGGVARSYHRDYYEGSDSPLHAGIGTDRLVVTWDLSSARVAARLDGESAPPSREELLRLPAVNPVTATDPPRCEPPVMPAADAVRIAVPADLQRLREGAPAVAMEWRAHTRAAFESCLADGYEVRELVRDGEVAWYVLVREVSSPASGSP
jgi:chorismate synthase